MGAPCTSSYEATLPDWHLLDVATPTSRQIKPKTPLGRQNHGSDLRVATPQTLSLSKPAQAPSS
jgi:hypothetical protein